MNYEQDSLTQWHFRHDALDAFNSFSAARNLFFWITVAGLLVIQGVFWAVDRGAIDSVLEIPQKDNIQINNIVPGGAFNTNTHSQGFVLCSFNPKYSFCQDLEVPKSEITVDSTANDNAQPSAAISKENAATIQSILEKTMQISKIVVILSIILFCVCLFLCIQLTLTGSLGGMSFSTNAFFFALVATLFILPWQKSVMAGIPAVLYSFDDIIKAYSAKAETSPISYYSRFVVMWSIAFILLLISQWRSSQAIKQITARAKEWKSVNPLSQHPPVQHAASSQSPVIPLAAQTGAPVATQPNHPSPQNPNDTGYGNSPIPLE